MESKIYIANNPAGYVAREERGVRVLRPVYPAMLASDAGVTVGYIGAGLSVSLISIASCEGARNACEGFCVFDNEPTYGSERVARIFAANDWALCNPEALEFYLPELEQLKYYCREEDSNTLGNAVWELAR